MGTPGAVMNVNFAASSLMWINNEAERSCRGDVVRAALRVLRPGGVLPSLGAYSSDLTIPLDAFAAGLGDHTIVTTLCSRGKERMHRLMAVMRPLVTPCLKLDEIEEAYDLFSHQRDGVLQAAITP